MEEVFLVYLVTCGVVRVWTLGNVPVFGQTRDDAKDEKNFKKKLSIFEHLFRSHIFFPTVKGFHKYHNS